MIYAIELEDYIICIAATANTAAAENVASANAFATTNANADAANAATAKETADVMPRPHIRSESIQLAMNVEIVKSASIVTFSS